LDVLKFKLNKHTVLSADDNNHVCTSKHYQLFPRENLMQTNYVVTSMAFMFLSASIKQFIVQKQTRKPS